MDISRGFVLSIISLLILFSVNPVLHAQPTGTDDSQLGRPLQEEGTELLNPDGNTILFPEEDSSTEDPFPGVGDGIGTTGIWNLVLALVLVLVTFWVIFRFVVRPLMRGAVMGRGIENFRIIATLPLAPTKSIQVIKLVDRILIVGISEGGMNHLTEITDPREVSEMLEALDGKNPAAHHPFRKAFDTILSRKDEIGFEDKQKKFNTTLNDLKEKIQAMKESPGSEEK